MIFYVFLFCCFLILYFGVIRVGIKLLKLKLTLGNKAIISYYPILGDFFNIEKSNKQFGDGTQIYKNRIHNNPNVKFILSNIFISPMIEIYDPEYYKEVLLNHENYGKMNHLLHEQLTSKGILFSPPNKWKQQRNTLGIPFTHAKLVARLPLINEIVLDALEKHDKVHVQEFTNSITSEVIIQSFLGDNVEGIKVNGKNLVDEIIQVINEVGELGLKDIYASMKQQIFGMRGWTILPNAREKAVNSRIDNLMKVIHEIIDKKIQNYKKKDNPNFLEIYIEAYLQSKEDDPLKITIQELCQMFISIFTAGTDSTGQVSAVGLYFLAQQVQDQQEIRDEINQVLGKDTLIDSHHLTQFVKLNAFINEVLRFKNPVFAPLVRIANKTHYIKDLKIEKGCYVFAYTSVPLWKDQYFTNADQFNYKRWLTPNPIKEDNGFVFLPFSGGARNCIGQHMAMMEIKLILAQTIRKYKLTLDPNVKVQWPIRVFHLMEPDTAIKFSKL